MREEDTGEKNTDIPSIVRFLFLMLALVFLVPAAFLQGKEHIGTRFVLIIIGACMLTAGITIWISSKVK